MWKGDHTSSIRGIGHAWRVAGDWSVDLRVRGGGVGVEPGRRRKAIGRLRQSHEFCITCLGWEVGRVDVGEGSRGSSGRKSGWGSAGVKQGSWRSRAMIWPMGAGPRDLSGRCREEDRGGSVWSNSFDGKSNLYLEFFLQC